MELGLLIDVLRRPMELPICHAGIYDPLDITGQPCRPNTLPETAIKFHGRGPNRRENGSALQLLPNEALLAMAP